MWSYVLYENKNHATAAFQYSAVKCALFPLTDNVPQNLTVVE